MNIYTLTFSDHKANLVVLLGTFSSFGKAWQALFADKDENMGVFTPSHREGIFSNPDLGIGTLDFKDVLDGEVHFEYNVNVTELDEVFDADNQVEL